MFNHTAWLSRLALNAASYQKTFRVVNLASGRDDADAIDISLMQNQATESASDKTGWQVDVRYQKAPDTVLFTETYPTEGQAKKVYEDLVMLAAEVEGLIKSEKFDEAKQKTEALMKKFTANSGQAPVSENDPGQQA